MQCVTGLKQRKVDSTFLQLNLNLEPALYHRTYIRVDTLTLCWVYLPWYFISPFINLWLIRFFCSHFSKVLRKNEALNKNWTKFNFAKTAKLTNSGLFNFLRGKLINCCICPVYVLWLGHTIILGVLNTDQILFMYYSKMR